MLKRTLTVDVSSQKIDDIFSALDQCKLPGAAVGVAVDGVPVYRKAFGLANMELPVLLSTSMRMRLASVTKHFAAFTWMLLCEEGLADIDDPIGKYLPELHPVAHAVTPRQLMGHMGGLRDSIDLVWHFSGTGKPASSEAMFALYRGIDDVQAAPGTVFNYTNGAYLILSTAIERITEQSLEQVMQERIFDAVGMPDTMLRRVDTDFVANSATLHMMNASGQFEKWHVGTALAGEGGMVSTVNDMLRWLAEMDACAVGSQATWEVMKAPMRLANGTSTTYGLGLVNRQYRGINVLSHSGGAGGGNAYILKAPDAGLDIVVLANRAGVFSFDLAYSILDACVAPLAPLRDAVKGRFVNGLFRSPQTGRVVQLFEQRGKQVVSIDGADIHYFELGTDSVLRLSERIDDLRMSFSVIGDLERPTALQLDDCGNADELLAIERIKDAPAKPITGRYHAPSVGVTAVIEESSDGPKLTTMGPFGPLKYSLESLTRHVWRGNPPPGMPLSAGVLSFDEHFARFSFSNCRTHRVKFQRG
jgi:D-aminopeptidase